MNTMRKCIASTLFLVQAALWSAAAHGQSPMQTLLDARRPNTTEPRYIKGGKDSQSPTLLVFIHGIFGDTLDTWKGSSGLTLAGAILQYQEFSSGYDAYAFGFPSSMVKPGSFSVTEASAALKRTWDFEKFSRYKQVVVVAHSMGGLIALESLTTFADMRSNVTMLITYATPYNGAQISTIARRVVRNDALSDMFPADSANGFLNSLNTRWKQYKITDKNPIFVKCAYETVPLPTVGLIVQRTSGDALCDGPADPISEDHIGITKPNSINHESVKVLVNALRSNHAQKTQTTLNSAPAGILVEEISTASLATDATYVAEKVHRNLAELLVNAGHRVIAPPTSVNPPASNYAYRFHLEFHPVGDKLIIGAQLQNGDGSVLANTEMTGRVQELSEIYKSIPAALIYGLDVDEVSLKKKDTARKPTEDNFAYALYLRSWRQMENGQRDIAERTLLRSVQSDPAFAMAYWALAELKRQAGAQVAADAYIKKAKSIDPDHRQMPAISAAMQDNPIGAVKDAVKSSNWKKLDSGLHLMDATASTYGVEVRAWKFSSKDFLIKVVEQRTVTGSSAEEHLVNGKELLAITGGFFNRDVEKRLSPAGILVTSGVVRKEAPNDQSGALAIDKRNNIDIVWAKSLKPLSEYLQVVQAGPVLVEPDGKMGIRNDDFDRLNRTAVCLTSDQVIFIDVRGRQNKGLSLFQLASLLLESPDNGGFGCRRALNLDGGPSTQAAYRDGKKVQVVPGLWKNQNSIVVSQR